MLFLFVPRDLILQSVHFAHTQFVHSMGAQITGTMSPWLLWWKVEGKGKGKIHPRTVLEDPVRGEEV